MDNTSQQTLIIYCRDCGAILQNLSDIKHEDKSPCGNCGSMDRFYVRFGAVRGNGDESSHTKNLMKKDV
jgi:DNA-directed RNA polymerase subunit RPC12/RpoP